MPGSSRLTAVGLLGGLVCLAPAAADAQRPVTPVPRPPLALSAPLAFTQPESTPGPVGTIDGVVRDARGEPVAGVVVTAIGATTTFAVTDERGHYELPALTPGSYLLRAHSTGYLAPKPRTVEVHPHVRTMSSFGIRPADAAPTILAAGVGGVLAPAPADVPPRPQEGAAATSAEPESASPPAPRDDNHSETAWRLRHLRRSVLRDVTGAGDLDDLLESAPDELERMAVALGRAVSSPARAATSLFADAPLSGQVNLLTTNLFDAPQELLSGASVARGIAYVKVGAPVGDHADWTVRGALNDGDLSSWIVAGAYQTRGDVRRARNIGLSYSTQRYGGGNPLTLRDVADGSRNAGRIYAFETLTLSPMVAVAYGGDYQRFDYLDGRNLVSPRGELTLKPAAHTRLSVALSSRADAPGAQEFQPPSDEGIWLPPQRTFSSVHPGQPLRAERTSQVSAAVERDFGPMTVAVRAFRQHVDNQMVTLFNAAVPEFPTAKLGHYVIGTAGDVDARGAAVALRADLGSRFRGSMAYTAATAAMAPRSDIGYLLLLSPSALRTRVERLHDLLTSVAAEVPETATRVLVFYRVGSGFARPGDTDDSRIDSRFDIQVRQSLPFLNFTSARWEMLIALRNSFRELTSDQSVYDELLTVEPPKRIIGGVTLHF